MILIRRPDYRYNEQFSVTFADWIERVSISFYLSSYYIKYYRFNLAVIMHLETFPAIDKCAIRML